MTEPMRVFDRRLVRLRRARFAREFATAGFLVEEVVERLLDRLGDIRRDFRRVLVLGAPLGLVETALAGRFGIERLVAADAAARDARRAMACGWWPTPRRCRSPPTGSTSCSAR